MGKYGNQIPTLSVPLTDHLSDFLHRPDMMFDRYPEAQHQNLVILYCHEAIFAGNTSSVLNTSQLLNDS